VNNSTNISLVCKRSGLIRSIAKPMKKIVYTTKVLHNRNISKLQEIYHFPKIGRRCSTHMKKYLCANVISLRIEDINEPIPKVRTLAMA
jgi:hypothetical protein